MDNFLAFVAIVILSISSFMVGFTYPPNKVFLFNILEECEQKLTREQHCVLIAVHESDVKNNN